MKIKIMVYSTIALIAGLVSEVQAQDCCGGTPLAADSICCNDQQFPDYENCCTSDQETTWQNTYDTCMGDAKSEKKTADDDEKATYDAATGALDNVAATDCGLITTPGSNAFQVCVDALKASPALAPEYIAALTAYGAATAGTELTYEYETNACITPAPGDGYYCTDGWQLKRIDP